MAITQKQERYARLVASGMDLHTAALEAGCKNHEAARKFVADMAKRENVQAFINELKTTHAGLNQGQTDKQATSSETEAKAAKYETPLEFLTSVFNNIGGLYTPKERITAAVALLPYTESKVAPIGKKEGEVNNAQEKSRNGRFATLSHEGKKLPFRQITSFCHWAVCGKYRGEECNYTGTKRFTTDGKPTDNPELDKCDGRLFECKIRGNEQRFGGYPASSLIGS